VCACVCLCAYFCRSVMFPGPTYKYEAYSPQGPSENFATLPLHRHGHRRGQCTHTHTHTHTHTPKYVQTHKDTSSHTNIDKCTQIDSSLPFVANAAPFGLPLVLPLSTSSRTTNPALGVVGAVWGLFDQRRPPVRHRRRDEDGTKRMTCVHERDVLCSHERRVITRLLPAHRSCVRERWTNSWTSSWVPFSITLMLSPSS
jgi:hypothetical protein